ncbi:hypothetical protein LWF15_20920 [Kineosporia rhizophila]|uniref:hypothetical protein n=1 Tax=Kineosporia rhizophila TaxID=84633 RepID=UPI001E2A33BA|nr:hypothetical protein [Kineosporia rhizophila]MCE0537959.1 hypothetical protein [Kineosporia rhizophila]
MSANNSRPLHTRFFTATAAAVLGAAVLLAGTGGESAQAITAQNVSAPLTQAAAPTGAQAAAYSAAARTPIQILKAARAKAKKAKTVRVQATIKDPGGTIKLDLRITKAGKATGSLSTPGDGSMKLILVSKKKGYFKPGKDMLEQIAEGDESVKEQLAGRWIEFGRGEGLDDAFELASWKTYTQDVFTLAGPQSGLVKVKGKKVKGYKKTIGLKERGIQGTLVIAADGTNRLAAYTHPEGRFTYTAWNAKVKIKAPANPLSASSIS